MARLDAPGKRVESRLRIAGEVIHHAQSPQRLDVFGIGLQDAGKRSARLVVLPVLQVEAAQLVLHIDIAGRAFGEILVSLDRFLVVFHDARVAGADQVFLRQGQVLILSEISARMDDCSASL